MTEVYKTKQKQIIYTVISEQKQDFTIKELFAEVGKKDKTIGLTTVYRAIHNMTASGIVSKITGPDGIVRYRYQTTCHDTGHCFLKCEKCGKVEHTDCKTFSKLAKHLEEKHHFAIDQKNLTIYGLCTRCRV